MLRIVPHTVPRGGRSYEHFPGGFSLHLLLMHTLQGAHPRPYMGRDFRAVGMCLCAHAYHFCGCMFLYHVHIHFSVHINCHVNVPYGCVCAKTPPINLAAPSVVAATNMLMCLQTVNTQKLDGALSRACSTCCVHASCSSPTPRALARHRNRTPKSSPPYTPNPDPNTDLFPERGVDHR